jgi:voltage-gated sodium channel
MKTKNKEKIDLVLPEENALISFQNPVENLIKRFFLNDKIILGVIILNSILIFLSGFDFNNHVLTALDSIDHLITIIFIIEIIVKVKAFKSTFFKSKWNQFDFLLILLSAPSLIQVFYYQSHYELEFLLVFRIFRVFKSVRFLKFIPGVDHLLRGTTKAIKSSIFVLIGFSIYIFIISILSFSIFGSSSPELFENPLKSIYTIFKVFTIEGWYEIPEIVASEMAPFTSFLTYCYFIFIVVSGGMLGLSLVNSVFVDAMLEDNNEDINERMILINNKLDDIMRKMEK